ncbi:MAG: hypothetical protein JSR66_19755 [Proteobacteria bacterium]|nr:hypothetical protein [Pseudomonadota bacterium]
MKRLSIVMSMAAAFALQTVAFAGPHYNAFVSVSKGSTSSSAYGSLSSARYYSSDSNQYIGCSSAADLVSSIYISCTARDAQGNYLYCYSNTADGQARQAVSSVNNTSSVYFLMNNSTGKCTYISISNFSYNL